MSRRAKENVCNSEAIPVRLHCPFVNCEKFYKSRKHLNEHFRWHPSHKPDTLPSTRVRVTAKECAEKFLDDEANPYTRKLRVKELFQLLTDDELKQFALPRIANIVTLAEFLLQGTSNKDQVRQKLVELRNELCLHYSEFNSQFFQEPPPLDKREQLVEIVQSNLPHSCDWIIEMGNGAIFKDFIMPKIFRKEYSGFEEFSCGIVGSFGIGQKETQDILRNKWGKKLEMVIGINPILSKDKIFGKLNDQRQELLKKIGLELNVFEELVVGHVDVEKYITLFLSQTGTQSAINMPHNNMIIMDYTDGFPWLKWSRHFTGETSVRIKIIEPYNLMSTILTVALWLGNDDYETVKKCAEPVFKQLKDLQSVTHPLSGKEIKIFRRSCGDGKERRSSTGSSSAKSSYPIPEAPEHQSQLGDMKLVCSQPVWGVEETVVMEEQFQNTLNDKAPTKQKRREFAKQNLGNMGRHNICGTPLADFYPGTAHLGFRSAETLCLRIARIASGLYLILF